MAGKMIGLGDILFIYCILGCFVMNIFSFIATKYDDIVSNNSDTHPGSILRYIIKQTDAARQRNSATSSTTSAVKQNARQRHEPHMIDQLDFYQHFYIEEVSPVFLSQEIVDDFYDIVKEDNDRSQFRDDQPQLAEIMPQNIKIMDRLWSAVKDGTLPPEEKEYFSKHRLKKPPDTVAVIKKLISHGSVLEVGSCTTAFFLARTYSNLSLLGIMTADELWSDFTLATITTSLPNLYLGKFPSDGLNIVTESLYSNPSVLFGNMILSNLTSLVDALLPHEFEEMLGRLLSLAKKTFITGFHMEVGKTKNFFEQSWSSVNELVKKSCAVADLSCSSRELTWTGSEDTSSWSRYMVLEVRVKHAVRQADDAACSQVRSNMKCQLHFGDDIKQAVLKFSDNTTAPGPEDTDALPFSVFKHLDLVGPTKSRMFLGALKLPYSPEKSITNFAVQGSSVWNNFSASSSDDEELHVRVQSILDLPNSRLGVKKFRQIHPERPGDLTDNVPTHLDKSESIQKQQKRSVLNGAAQLDRSVLASKLKTEKSAAPVDTQVDGVAESWSRVESKTVADNKREDQQYLSIGKHWDRENLDSPREDPLQAQEKKALARFDQAWDRESPVSEQGRKNAVSAAGRRTTNDDSVLRRDEKELRRAMGFLHGETDVKELEAVMNHRQRRPAGHTLHLRRKSFTPASDGAARGQETSTAVMWTVRTGSTSTTFSSSHILSKPSRRDATHPDHLVPVTNDPDDSRLKFLPPQQLNKPPVRMKNESLLRIKRRAFPPRLLDAMKQSSAKLETRLTGETPFKLRILDKLSADRRGLTETARTKNATSETEAGLPPGERAGAQRKEGVVGAYDAVDIAGDAVFTAGDVGPRVLHEELEQILRDDEPEKKDSVDAQKPDPKVTIPIDDGADDYAGVGDEKDEYNTENAEDVGDQAAAHMNQDSPVMEEVQNNDDDMPEGDVRDTDEEVNDGAKELTDAEDQLDVDDKLKVVAAADQGQLEYGEFPRSPEELDEHVYDEVQMNYDVVGKKNTRRLLAEDVSDNIPSVSLKKVLSRIPTKHQQHRHSHPKVKAKSHARGHTGEMDKNTDEPKVQAYYRVSTLGSSDPEEMQFNRLWRQVQPTLKEDHTITNRQPFNMLTYGSRSMTLFGLKVARSYPSAYVVSLNPTRGLRDMVSLRKVIENVGADNIALLRADLSAALVETLSRSPDLAKYQILGLEVFEWLLHFQMGFPAYLGRLLSLATTTFLQVPDPRQLALLVAYFKKATPGEAPKCVFRGMVHEALRMINAENSTVTLLPEPAMHSPMNIDRQSPTRHLRLLRIHIKSMRRPVQVDCGTGMAYLSVRSPGVAYLSSHTSNTEVKLDRAGKLFSLNLLLEAGLRQEARERSRFFGWYLRQSLHQDMCPLHIIWYNSSLVYRGLFSNSAVPPGTAMQRSKSYNNQVSIKSVHRELQGPSFSFLEYGSQNGDLVISVAKLYPDSTVLSIIDNQAARANAVFQRAKSKDLANLVVLNTTLNERLTGKLLHSPEFLRYQFIGVETFLGFVSRFDSRQKFDLAIGQMISTGATTLIQVPSDTIISLAMETFFPYSYNGKLRTEKQDPKVYYLSEHPRPIYINSERKLIGESAKADVDIEISTRVVKPSNLGVTTEHVPWKLLRVDVKNLTMKVNHHFDYMLDGHSRKYTLRCETSNQTGVRVWLRRHADGLEIPYGGIHVVSLIALLRMGLLEETKMEFYDKFLALPLYEDMAPWNIAFDAGNLTYIDYDSRNVTFNALAPAAFQVIVMLFNYERTVKDFGKCKQQAKVNYGINIIGRCVGSKFLGPCEDTRAPVPCGDGTCKSTYIECLQALQKLEAAKDRNMLTYEPNPKEGLRPIEESPFSKDTWKFGPTGVVNKHSKQKTY